MPSAFIERVSVVCFGGPLHGQKHMMQVNPATGLPPDRWNHVVRLPTAAGAAVARMYPYVLEADGIDCSGWVYRCVIPDAPAPTGDVNGWWTEIDRLESDGTEQADG